MFIPLFKGLYKSNLIGNQMHLLQQLIFCCSKLKKEPICFQLGLPFLLNDN